MLECPEGCGYSGTSLGGHYRFSKHCRPSDEPPPTWAKRPRNLDVAARLFANRVACTMGKALLSAHVDRYMDMTEVGVLGCTQCMVVWKATTKVGCWGAHSAR